MSWSMNLTQMKGKWKEKKREIKLHEIRKFSYSKSWVKASQPKNLEKI